MIFGTLVYDDDISSRVFFHLLGSLFFLAVREVKVQNIALDEK